MAIPGAALIDSFLKGMAADTVFLGLIVVTIGAGVFGGDKFTVGNRIGMAGAAGDLAIDQMSLVGKIKSEDIVGDFFDTGVAVETCG